ncbi:MAG: PocR ligand-binding domain-containing protein, partial [Salinisphaera sp.]|nr:PocR ligand-binding domain-containing protein [Salinisphaera sp.]
MISPAHDSLFTPKLWDAALEKYALVTHLTVQLFNVDARLVLGPIHPTPVFQLFEKKGYDPGIFPECARRCIAQTDSRQAITVSQVQGLAAVGAPLMLDDKIVGAAVGGYVFQDFIQSSDIQSLARQAGIHFAELWELVRHQPPVPQRRLQVHGELLQVLGDSLLGEHHRARQYEEAAAALRRWNEDLEARVGERTAELLASQDRLRGLAAELNLAEQHERKRLAVELHDHLQQILVLGRLNLGRGKRLAKSLPACVKVIKETDELLLDALKYTHTLVAELSPPVLRDHGLAAGLQWL